VEPTVLPAGPRLDAHLLWDALVNDTDTVVMVLDALGVVRTANGAATALSPDGAPILGRRLEQVLGAEEGAERLQVVRRVLATGTPERVLSMVRGVMHQATYRRQEPAPGGDVLFALMVSMPVGRVGLSNAYTGARIAMHHDLGRLATLSERELEILREIGMGKTTEGVAQTLGKSVKTIELHVASKAELMRIAIDSGLTAVDRAYVPVLARSSGRLGRRGASREGGPHDDGASVDENGRGPLADRAGA
jgi:DNA-binding CsgD family transcriptional regulator